MPFPRISGKKKKKIHTVCIKNSVAQNLVEKKQNNWASEKRILLRLNSEN